MVVFVIYFVYVIKQTADRAKGCERPVKLRTKTIKKSATNAESQGGGTGNASAIATNTRTQTRNQAATNASVYATPAENGPFRMIIVEGTQDSVLQKRTTKGRVEIIPFNIHQLKTNDQGQGTITTRRNV